MTARTAPARRIELAFHNEGVQLAANLYLPPDLAPDERRPAILLLPGYVLSQDVTLPDAAQYFVDHGYVAMTADYRGFGRSGGPRWRLICEERVRDCRVALALLADRPEVDAARLGIYGSSFGGSVAAAIAGRDTRARAIAVVGSPGDGEAWMRSQRSYPQWRLFLKRLEEDARRRARGEASEEVALMELVPNDDPAGAAYLKDHHFADPNHYGRVPLESGQSTMEFKPVETIHRVAPRAVLFIHGSDDPRVPLEQALQMYERAREPKRLAVIPGAHHYDVTNPGPHFQETLDLARNWFDAHVKPPVEPYSVAPYLAVESDIAI